jgi:hypothetical protein
MEVHKPKLVANWREFLKEYAIIVVGVLTALFAEQAVQSIDWRHKVDAAVSDMDNELSAGDGPQAYQRLIMHDCIASRLTAIQASLERGDRSATGKLIDGLWVPNRTWDSLAREAATASDVAAHMPHERMLQYRIAYEMVPAMQRLAEKELVDLGHLRALPSTGGPLTTGEKLAELDAVQALAIDNDTFARESRFLLIRMRLMHMKLDRNFVKADVRQARMHYDGCLSGPDLPPFNPGRPPSLTILG